MEKERHNLSLRIPENKQNDRPLLPQVNKEDLLITLSETDDDEPNATLVQQGKQETEADGVPEELQPEGQYQFSPNLAEASGTLRSPSPGHARSNPKKAYIAANNRHIRNFIAELFRKQICCWESKVFVTLLSFCLLIVCIVQVAWYNLVTPRASDYKGDMILLHGSHLHKLGVPQDKIRIRQARSLQYAEYTWEDLVKLDLKSLKILHFQVNEAAGEVTQEGHLIGELSKEALKISGRPTFCERRSEYVPSPLEFGKVTHLHLSQMGNCSFYSNIIVSEWRFPKIHSLRLHACRVAHELFNSLSSFIDRHNESLHLLDVDECQLCPSPKCEAGLLNLPQHDFQLKITRLREWTGNT